MKKQIVVVGVCLFFITLCLSGCEEIEQKDYITVACSGQILVYIIDKNYNKIQEVPVGVLLNIEFVKAGGERCVSQKATDAAGVVWADTCTFKLYREQNIEVIVTVQGGYKDYYPESYTYFRTLTWAEVEHVGLGESYSWIPIIPINLKNDTVS